MSDCVLSYLQNSLEQIYAIDTHLPVSRFLVDDGFLDLLPTDTIPLLTLEQLFVMGDFESVDLALYIAPDVLDGLKKNPPQNSLNTDNFAKYMIALEGVSHFVFLVFRAQNRRPVSQLELEIQAEIDKFVHAWFLLAQQGKSLTLTASWLMRRLFRDFVLTDGLKPEAQQRYLIANRVAQIYCQCLLQRYVFEKRLAFVFDEVRNFYRRGLADKIRLI